MKGQTDPPDMTVPFRLGDWTVEPQLNRVSNGDRTEQLEPRLTQVLLCLARRQGSVVPRVAILDEVWPDVVVGEENLTGAISELRAVLGDDAQSPRYIETIRKGGYRLLTPVELSSSEAPPLFAPSRRLRSRLMVAAGLLLVVVVALVGIMRERDQGDSSNVEARPLIRDSRPLTSFTGSEIMPALSPDGTRVAFAWHGTAGSDDFDVFVKQENTETPLRLTESPGFDGWPQWSPDGLLISYYHQDEQVAGIFEVPSIGGGRRLLVPGPGPSGAHSWSPDGRTIAFAQSGRVHMLDREGGTVSRLTDALDRCCGDDQPMFSPSGESVAFVRTDGAQLQDLYLVSVLGGEERRLTTGLLRIRGFGWLPDGGGILVSSLRSGRYSLWQVDARNGTLKPVSTKADWVLSPTLALRADRLCFQVIDLEVNLWRYGQNPLDDSGMWIGEKFVSSTRVDIEGAYSPDGRSVAFVSGRSGSVELWKCAADGSQPVRLTGFQGAMVAGPVWSPDGNMIAFTACPEGSCEAFVIAPSGGPARPLTDTAQNSAAAGWSADSRYLYVDSDRGGDWQLYKLPVDDPGEIRVITNEGGLAGMETLDGSSIVFARPDKPGLWRIDLEGEQRAVQILADSPQVGRPGLWDQCEHGIVTAVAAAGESTLWFTRWGSVESKKIADMIEVTSPTLSVTRDCRSLLIGHTERGASDLVIAEIESGATAR